MPSPPTRQMHRSGARLSGYRWPLVVSAVSLAANAAYLFLWVPVVHGASIWDTGSDLWGMFRAAHYVGWGYLGGVYAPGNGVVTFPGMPVVLAPVALLASTMHLTESYPPFFPPHPTAALLLQPIEMVLSCSLLFAVEIVARRLGVPARRRAFLCAAVGVVAWPVTAVWGHAEDTVAIALCLLALSALVEARLSHAGWLFGLAVVMQPLVLGVLPLAIGFTVPSRRSGFSIRALVPPAALLGLTFATAPANTYRAVVEQPTQPWTDHATPWIGTAPVIAPARSYLGVMPGVVRRGGHLQFVSEKVWVHLGPTVAGGPSRWPYLLIAVAIGVYAARRRGRLGGEQLVWFAGAVLALRCAFEAVMTPYYLGPPLIVLLLAGAVRSSKVLGLTWALGMAVTVYSYARLGPWAWWSPIVLTMAVILVLVRPRDPAPVPRRTRDSEPVVGDWDPASGLLASPAAQTARVAPSAGASR